MLRYDRDDGQADDVADDGRADAAADGVRSHVFRRLVAVRDRRLAGHALEVPVVWRGDGDHRGLPRLLRFLFRVREEVLDRVPGRREKIYREGPYYRNVAKAFIRESVLECAATPWYLKDAIIQWWKMIFQVTEMDVRPWPGRVASEKRVCDEGQLQG